MTKHTRRIFFYSLTLVFAAATPLLLGYSLGYKLNFTEGEIEKTGGIFIKSKTPRLSVFLNGVFMKETSLLSGGTLLTRVSPGNYLLRLEKVQHVPWSKTVAVRKDLVTELRNIILLSQGAATATTTEKEVASLKATSTPDKNLYLSKKGEILIRGREKQGPLAANVHSFFLVNDTLVFVDRNGFIAKKDLADNATATLSRPGLYLNTAPVKFLESPRGEIALIDPSGGLFIITSSGRVEPIEGGLLSVYFDGNGDKLLLVKERSIEVLWRSDNPYQPFQKAGTKEKIMEFTFPVEDSRWFYGDNAHIFIKAEAGIFMTELDGRGGRNTVEIISGKKDELFTHPDLPHTIFFRKGKIWQKIKI